MRNNQNRLLGNTDQTTVVVIKIYFFICIIMWLPVPLDTHDITGTRLMDRFFLIIILIILRVFPIYCLFLFNHYR